MKRHVLIMLGALTGLLSCSPYRNVCGDLRDGLKRCGFAVTQVDCSALAYSDVEALIERLDARGCEGFSTDGDLENSAVDKRVCTLGHFACPDSPTPAFTKANTRGPVVFVGGIDDSALLDWHPRIVAAVNGHHVSVLPWATTSERANDLFLSLSALSRHTNGQPMNLICYAVAGLDCRAVVSSGGVFADQPERLARARAMVASITTIATPHRGTRVADAAIQALRDGTADELLQAFTDSQSAVHVPDDAALIRTLEGLTPEALEKFNARVIDAEGITYQSYAGVSSATGRSTASAELLIREFCSDDAGQLRIERHANTTDVMNPALLVTTPFSTTTRRASGENETSPSDGMIAVASARWGVFRGCVPADHYDVIGQIGHLTRDPVTGFDAPLFYQRVVAMLAQRGL